MIRCTRAAVLAAALLAAVVPCYAQDALTGTLKTIQTRKSVLVGYVTDAFPMSFAGEGGKAQGYSVELCERIAEEAGKAAGLAQVEIKYVPVTLAERFDAVASGKIDIECATSTITLARMQKVDFTYTTFLDGGSLLVKRGSGIHGIASLIDETVGVIPGTTTEPSLRDALKRGYINAKVVPVKDHAEGMALLQAGKITAYASDRVILIGLLIKAANREAFELAPEQFSIEPYGFAVRRNDSDFRLVANRVLARMYRSGAVLKVFDKWFGDIGQPTPTLAAMYLLNATPE
jgi:ABC-type amino acid transport substrate-binding protein